MQLKKFYSRKLDLVLPFFAAPLTLNHEMIRIIGQPTFEMP
jgi:hypothetical protein